MLLGASAHEHELTVDMQVIVDPTGDGDAGVPDGLELLRYASALTEGSDDLSDARGALVARVGRDGLCEAAATVAIFHGLVRVADGTGIQLDPTMLTATASARAALGIDRFAGAANSIGASTVPRRTSDEQVKAMFD